MATNFRRDKLLGLTVRPELVEGWTVKPFMVRQAHHERLNLRLPRLKLVARFLKRCMECANKFFAPECIAGAEKGGRQNRPTAAGIAGMMLGAKIFRQ